MLVWRILRRFFAAYERLHNRLHAWLMYHIGKMFGWECYDPTPAKAKWSARLRVTIPSIRFSFTGEKMSFVIRNDQAVEFTPVFEDAHGNVADELGSKPVWSVTDDSIATLVVAEDGLSAVLEPTGKKGTTRVDLIVDADPAAEIEEPVLAYAEVTVLSGKATMIRLLGAVIDKPAATVAPTEEPTLPPETEAPTEAPTEPPVTEEPTTPPVSEEPTEPPASEEPVETTPPAGEEPTAAPDPTQDPTSVR